MYAWHPPRTLSASLSIAIVALIGAVLVLGLGVRRTIEATVPLVSVSLDEPPPPPREPPKPPPPKTKSAAAKGKPSARNLRNQATPVVAPPVQPIIVPPPIVTAPKAGTGAAANTGASNVAGPGQGAGGFGNGNGGGGNGGDGDDDEDSVVGPRQVGGKLRYQDLPEGLLAPGQEASVGVIYRVERDGHATHCRIEHSSGIPMVDNTACRLIEARFRFKPALDEDGRPVSALVTSTHTWIGREER